MAIGAFRPAATAHAKVRSRSYVVQCPGDVPDGGLTLEGSGNYPQQSDVFSANITDKCTQGQWTNIIFKRSQ